VVPNAGRDGSTRRAGSGADRPLDRLRAWADHTWPRSPATNRTRRARSSRTSLGAPR